VDVGYKYKSMVIKGLYDFFLIAKNGQGPVTTSILPGFKRKYNVYCFFASSLFNHSQKIHFQSALSATRFKKQFEYLINHPKMQSGYQLVILYGLRISEVFQLIVTAPFSESSRKYIMKKVGNTARIKQYMQKLLRGE
jgi:hypothetical protein